MKVVSNEALTKLIQLIKSTFIKKVNTVEVEERELAAVATSGSYNDLANKPTIPAAQVNSDWNATSGVALIMNKPTIPTKTSNLTNDSGFITSSSIANMQTTTNLVTSVSSASTNSQYPSAKLFYDTCGDIEALINAL